MNLAEIYLMVSSVSELGVSETERERSTQGDCVLFSSVGLWEGFLGVKITQILYHLGVRAFIPAEVFLGSSSLGCVSTADV